MFSISYAVGYCDILSAFDRDVLRAERQRAFWAFINALCRPLMLRPVISYRTVPVQIWEYG